MFFHVAETGSLTAASAALGLPKSTVSRRLSRLEDELETQLLLRTPRAVQLTELGQILHRQGAPALAYLDDVRRALQEHADVPAGPLRVAAPPDLAASQLGALLSEFVVDCPEVEVNLVTAGEFVDLITQGFDVALRIHAAPLSSVTSLRVRRLAKLDRGLYAAPTYLAEHGRPRGPDDLQRHACLTMVVHAKSWTLTRVRGGTTKTVPIASRLVSDDPLTLRNAAEHGAGIAPLPTYLGDSGVRRGTLVRLMPGWSMGSATLSIVWPATHHTSPRIRAFVDAAAAHFRRPPWAS